MRVRELRALAAVFGRAGATAQPQTAFALLLADLEEQQWDVEVLQGEVWVTAPNPEPENGEPLTAVKGRLRASLVAARDNQLADRSVATFLRRMEAKRVHDGKRVSVLSLVDDGHDLALRLKEAAGLPPSERGVALERIVAPELEIATADELCSTTGLPLLDIWRYFRHTWSLEYRPTPGRTVFLIIRNGARPMRPVMGIAALASALPQLRVRDNWIGWTPHTILRDAKEGPARWAPHRSVLLRTLQSARSLVRADDLLSKVGKAHGAELEARLLSLASAAAAKREAGLKERQESLDRGEEVVSLRNLPRLANGAPDWRTASERPLFEMKRAKTLADILFAERVLTAAEDAPPPAQMGPEFLRALAIAVREVKKVGLASRLLDINVCGAIPPYRDLIGGKLAALAAGSAEVAAWYRERYSAQASEITSQMAGREVVRSPEVCVLTTTSLYGVAASQYNRLKLTLPDRPPVSWTDLGSTEGFGTVHLTEETVTALRGLAVAKRGGRNVNNVFGEGNSPRMRQVREGLDTLGISSDVILRHSSPRRMYGLELYPGARDSLRFNEVRPSAPPPFAELARGWRERWLLRRIERRDVIARVAAIDPETVRQELMPPPSAQLTLFEEPQRRAAAPPPQGRTGRIGMAQDAHAELIQSLYKAVGGLADHHDPKTVEALHIETPVEQFIRDRALMGAIIFLTGNPGDGKTHLLRRMEAVLRAARVELCLDANVRTEAELIKLIDQTSRRKTGAVLAINEGTLVGLLRAAHGLRWVGDLEEQLLHPLTYVPQGSRVQPDSRAATARLQVVDLNLRNNLASETVLKAIRRHLELCAPCEGCPVSTCAGQRNAARLGKAAVAERLAELLDAVGRGGFHATMRDLHGLLAFMLFADADCAAIKDGAPPVPYWDAAFEGGSGALFEALRTLDPRLHAMPLLDDELWRGMDSASDWALPFAEERVGAGSLDDRRERFISQKRRAFFEHARGAAFLPEAGTQEEKLFRALTEGRSSVTALVRLLNKFFDRNEKSGDVLYLWTTHRYDARPNRYAASSLTIAASSLEIAIPQLRAGLADAFPEYRPDHVVLRTKGGEPSEGLRIDRSLVLALVKAEEGLPASFRSGEPEARLAAFYDRLSRRARADLAADIVEVRFVDMDTGQNFQLRVDVASRQYEG
ncbi:MAG TPA: Druantia anti-phage system protein DruA [Myxococcaceae bacterium]|nr:Druantia anti-phage system protein DruA [Myxococcaceae bacterium]